MGERNPAKHMRLNRYIATYTDLSRRKADALIEGGTVVVNRKPAHVGMEVNDTDTVIIDGKKLVPVRRQTLTVLLNKPVGYVCSKDGQGSPTVYDLLQKRMHHLNVAGRLDKDSSGLVVLTNDGQLMQELTHPSGNKKKIYEVTLDKELNLADWKRLQHGVDIGDGRLSKIDLRQIKGSKYEATMHEGRNRQIRRTFEALKYKVVSLHRTKLGPYELQGLNEEQFKDL